MLRNLTESKKRKPARGARSRTQAWKPTVELLEDRTLLSFMAPINYSVGRNGPQSVAVADLRHNGRLDFAVAGPGGVDVFLGNGDGSFQPFVAYPAGLNAFAITAGDLHADSIPDLVVTNASPTGGNTVSVLLGNGDGSFQSPRTFQVGNRPTAVALGELYGNSALDIVTANKSDGTVSVLRGNGDGTFQTRVNYTVGRAPNGLAVSDLRHNGRLDIVVSNEGSLASPAGVNVLLNNGGGTFGPAQDYPLSGGPRGVAVGDLNGDGIPDLITANDTGTGTGSVSVHLGNGDGTFEPPVSFAIDIYPISMTLADLNQDGHFDFVVTNLAGVREPDTVMVLFGNGDGTFQAPVHLGAGRLPNAVAAADLAGTGHLDLVVADTTGSDVSVTPSSSNLDRSPSMPSSAPIRRMQSRRGKRQRGRPMSAPSCIRTRKIGPWRATLPARPTPWWKPCKADARRLIETARTASARRLRRRRLRKVIHLSGRGGPYRGTSFWTAGSAQPLGVGRPDAAR